MIARRLILMCFAFAALLAPAGCSPAGQQEGTDLSGGLGTAEPDSGELVDEDEEYRRRVAVWLMADDDKDGLSNRIELKYGLDPNDPTDGPDIDGDGILNFRDRDVDGDGIENQTDPDIDGDGLSNLLDPDIDGDGIANGSDFDMDSDGVRDPWDWDDNSNGKDDADDEEPAQQPEEEDDGFDAAVEDLMDDIAAAEKISDPTLRQKTLAKYRDDLRGLLAEASKDEHEGRPISPGDEEIALIAESLADRFKGSGVTGLKHDVKAAITLLTPLQGKPDPNDPTVFLPPDAADAVEAVFRQGVEVKEPGRAEAAKELQNRLDALTDLKGRLRQKEITAVACSDAVSKLAAMPGGENPQEKVNCVMRLWGAIREPKLEPLIGDLGDITKSLQERTDDWSWDTMVDALTRLNALPGEGSLREKFAGLAEKFDGLMRIWDLVDEPDLAELVTGLEQLAEKLGERIEGAGWSWDEMISALESAPGIENGIGADQIEHAVKEVAETE